ncbi:hypothetical protein [Kocuria sp. HMSC066H03]|uniref:hypothetical protein n=1 Tax=Kocuria sp. HMSC066H03 TaxID=1739337 RepID=UPI00114CBA59|nr:hypothetical protein [Kocuria sp. HMSC066H03]
MPITFQHAQRDNPEGLIVFMPSAVTAARRATGMRTFSRFSWADDFPRHDVLALLDPALPDHPGITGAWFVHPNIDVVHLIANFVTKTAASRGINEDDIFFYGSSLGGFGAIAVASRIPGSQAVAEVPQVDVGDWVPESIQAIEDIILGDSLASLRQKFPERLNLLARIKHSGHVPQFFLVTNTFDSQFGKQTQFFRELAELSTPPPHGVRRTHRHPTRQGARSIAPGHRDRSTLPNSATLQEK